MVAVITHVHYGALISFNFIPISELIVDSSFTYSVIRSLQVLINVLENFSKHSSLHLTLFLGKKEELNSEVNCPVHWHSTRLFKFEFILDSHSFAKRVELRSNLQFDWSKDFNAF